MLFLTLLCLCEMNKRLQSEPAGGFVDSVVLPGFWALGSQVTSGETAPAAASLVPLEGSLISCFSVSLHPPEAAAGFPVSHSGPHGEQAQLPFSHNALQLASEVLNWVKLVFWSHLLSAKGKIHVVFT